MLQVLWADAVYAVTWEDPHANYPLCIGGGTKWAAQAYINRFEPLGSEPEGNCRLFFYEVNSQTWRLWLPASQAWQELSVTPGIHRSWCFAGIGSRELQGGAEEAVKAIFTTPPLDRFKLSSVHETASLRQPQARESGCSSTTEEEDVSRCKSRGDLPEVATEQTPCVQRVARRWGRR
eukprot:TRINITY_DN19674_c0_g1_i2.p1 TRINITY_DN19674_c0_g1~~TRINITY_DN19674_c0_g1_i2.p1  ORF type:complete len:178 (-),score=16.01 TRINITY_DN19674_c0_g1_i2:100-633(-)